MSKSNNDDFAACVAKPMAELPAQVRRRLERAALTPPQQALVCENRALVHLHLKHTAARWSLSWTSDDQMDLLQEGCLGLIRAAQDFDPTGNIPFAAFALPRIHKAVSRALSRKSPDAPARAAIRASAAIVTRRRRRSVPDDPLEILGHWHGTGADTIGVRLREKYDRAVRRAVGEMLTDMGSDPNRKAVRMLAEERHLVADLPARMPFRKIAAVVGLPYPRITQYDRQLRSIIARILSQDPEFAELQRVARGRAEGVDARADAALDACLARLGAAEIIQRILNAPAHSKGQAMTRLLDLAGTTLIDFIRRELEALPPNGREELISTLTPSGG